MEWAYYPTAPVPEKGFHCQQLVGKTLPHVSEAVITVVTVSEQTHRALEAEAAAAAAATHGGTAGGSRSGAAATLMVPRRSLLSHTDRWMDG